MPKPKVTFFIDQEMLDMLKALSAVTRVKQADYIREGIEMVLRSTRPSLRRPKRKGVMNSSIVSKKQYKRR